MADNKQIHLTDARIRALKPQTKACELADAGSPGLRLRISPKGRKTWFYRYRHPQTGKLRKLTLGTYPGLSLAKARALWADLSEARETGADPSDQLQTLKPEKTKTPINPEPTQILTTGKLVEDYVEHISQSKRSWLKDKQALERELLPYHRDAPAGSLTRADMRALLDRIRARGAQVQANRVLACLRAMYNWALETDWPDNQGLLQGNPCHGIKAMKERPKERTLNELELRQLLERLPVSGLPERQQDLIRLILLTGCRAGEACGLEWADIYGDQWRLPAHKSKNGRVHIVYLSAPAQAVLERQKARSKSKKWVFHNPASSLGHERGDTMAKALKSILPVLELEPFTLHDLRRTMATWLGENQVDEAIHDRMLNHVTGGIRKVYNTAKYNEPARQWWDKWGEYVYSLGSCSRQS